MADLTEKFMRHALMLAQKAAELDEVPVGAVIEINGEIVGEGFNQPISSCDPTAHAEIIALRDAAERVGNYRLPEANMYVTIEPCSMCAGAIVHARIKHLYYGAPEPKAGVACSQESFFDRAFLNHKVQVTGGFLSEDCAKLIQEFFQNKRR